MITTTQIKSKGNQLTGEDSSREVSTTDMETSDSADGKKDQVMSLKERFCTCCCQVKGKPDEKGVKRCCFANYTLVSKTREGEMSNLHLKK